MKKHGAWHSSIITSYRRCAFCCPKESASRNFESAPRFTAGLGIFVQVHQLHFSVWCYVTVELCRFMYRFCMRVSLSATNHWKNTVFRDFPTFSRTCIFFLLTLSLLWSSLFYSSLLSDSAHLCFSSVHIVRSLTSKLPSVIPNT